MAHAAIAFAKAKLRRQMMACTTSIGPGATNMVTAAALAHVNRLPVLLLPGDIFANRRPDPVLQQVEDFGDGTVTANDCFRPVSRYFDRITRPEQLLTSLPRALAGADRPRRVRPGDARAVPGRAGRGLRLSGSVLRAADIALPPAGARCARSSLPRSRLLQRARAAADRRRRRRALLRRPRRRSQAFAARHRHAGRRDPGGQGRLAVRPSAERRLHRRHRLGGRQRARRRGRCAARDRHPAAGFHHRLAGAVPGRRDA